MPLDPRDPQTHQIIGAAIEVHRNLGPGLLESTYEECLSFEFAQRSIAFVRQAPMPVAYKGVELQLGYRADFIVQQSVIVELKCVDKLIKVHDAQILTYMKLTQIRKGLLINFNSQPLIEGIKRFVL